MPVIPLLQASGNTRHAFVFCSLLSVFNEKSRSKTPTNTIPKTAHSLRSINTLLTTPDPLQALRSCPALTGSAPLASSNRPARMDLVLGWPSTFAPPTNLLLSLGAVHHWPFRSRLRLASIQSEIRCPWRSLRSVPHCFVGWLTSNSQLERFCQLWPRAVYELVQMLFIFFDLIYWILLFLTPILLLLLLLFFISLRTGLMLSYSILHAKPTLHCLVRLVFFSFSYPINEK